METPIADVADTAFWIAEMRARESARPDALFSDPLAARLAGERGAVIAQSIPWNDYVAWSVALRTVIIDDFVRQSVATGTDTVLNLGAGLDTRPYRLDLPTNLRWIEADQAAVLAYKESRLREERSVCALERWSVDLADGVQRRELLDRAAAGSRRTLVLTEGVVPYLENSAVSDLADELRERRVIQGWILDFISPLERFHFFSVA
jgi:methyltransferase (TIGR00027 family)